MLIGVLALLVAGSLRAQQNPPKVAVGGGSPDDRASARLLYWNVPANAAAGQLASDPVTAEAEEQTRHILRASILPTGTAATSSIATQAMVQIGEIRGAHLPHGSKLSEYTNSLPGRRRSHDQGVERPASR
jgi:hypothetical protein